MLKTHSTMNLPVVLYRCEAATRRDRRTQTEGV